MELVIESDSIENAIQEGLRRIGKKREDVSVNILEKGDRDFLGLTGKNARVKIIYESDKKIDISEEAVTKVKDFLRELLSAMKFEADIETHVIEDYIQVTITSPQSSLLIGRRGSTLNSIQFLTNLIVNKENRKEKINVLIDTENYRNKRKAVLEKLANRLAKKVKMTRKKITLEPMNSFERRIIHSYLATINGVQTESVDEYPNRKIIIRAV